MKSMLLSKENSTADEAQGQNALEEGENSVINGQFSRMQLLYFNREESCNWALIYFQVTRYRLWGSQ